MLKSIRGYRPQQVSEIINFIVIISFHFQTIFEVAASRSKSAAVQVMKSKRFHFISCKNCSLYSLYTKLGNITRK